MFDHDDIVTRLRRYKRGPCIEAADARRMLVRMEAGNVN